MTGMLPKLPRHLPELADLLASLHIRDSAELSSYLNISPRAAARLIAADHAPRPVQLALFWPTHCGRDELSCDSYNARQMQRTHILALQAEVSRLQATMQQLVRNGRFDSANDPGVCPCGAPGSMRCAHSSLTGFALPGNDP